MKKLIPRKWYSLETAAKRLSVFFNDDVTIKDILELALENEIRICWDMRGHYLQPEKINDLPAAEVFEAFGYYELSISEYPWNNEWLKELIRETPSNEFATSKLLVKDRHGNNFTIVSPLWTKTDSGRNVQYFGGNFYPSIVDILIYAKDLEEFEQRLQDQVVINRNSSISDKGISNECYREALGLMALIISKEDKTYRNSKGKPQHSTIAQAVQAKANEILGDNAEKYGGLSNLSKAISEGLKQLDKNL